jgi:hypothetical protein
VVSVILLTIRNKKESLLCSNCAIEQAKEKSTLTLLAGWWGIPFGPIASYSALIHHAVSVGKFGNKAKGLWIYCLLPVLFAALSIFAIMAMGSSSLGFSASDSPAKTAFRDANALIVSHTNGAHHGNSEAAIKMAAEFSEFMSSLESVFFSGGDENRTFSLTNEQFLTYCRVTDTRIVFLVHVPQFKQYKGEVRDGLIKLAWTAAMGVTAQHEPEADIELVVGLRGVLVYGGTAIGPRAGEPATRNEAAIGNEIFYPYFHSSTDPQPDLPESTEVLEAELPVNAPVTEDSEVSLLAIIAGLHPGEILPVAGVVTDSANNLGDAGLQALGDLRMSSDHILGLAAVG